MILLKMALKFKTLYKNCNFLYQNITKPVKWNLERKQPLHILPRVVCYNMSTCRSTALNNDRFFTRSIRKCSTQEDKSTGKVPPPIDTSQHKKPGLIKRFKEMYKNYWYVLVPVHMGTSAIWFGTFYYTVRSGVDIQGLLVTLGVSESIMAPLKNSGAGYIALTFALYKIATPLRYAVTIGGTTYAIRKLTAVGWIKPVPSRERLKEMYQEKKYNIQDRFNESKQHYQTQVKEKGYQVMEEVRKYKTEMRNIKNKVKKM